MATPADLRARAARPQGVDVGVVGGSMRPTVSAGQRVTVRACPYLWPGDVVLFETEDGCMLHRALFEVPGLGWIAQVGDAGGPVGIIHRSRVIGRGELPRRLPPPRAYASAARALAGAALRVARRGDWSRPFRARR